MGQRYSLPQEDWGAESWKFKPLHSYEQMGIFPVQREEKAVQTIRQLSALDCLTSLLKQWFQRRGHAIITRDNLMFKWTRGP